MHYLVEHVDGLAAALEPPPAMDELLRVGEEDGIEPLHRAWGEERRHELSLAAPILPDGADNAVAQQQLAHGVVGLVLFVILPVGDSDVSHVLWVRHQE